MNLKLLILDDEPIQRKGIISKIHMSELPITIIGEAGDGIEGLGLVRQEQPDIVITDIRMPEMDGLAFIEQAQTYNPELVFIIISGHSDFEYAKRALRNGVSDYLLKPIDEVELRNILLKLILKIEEARKNRLEIEKMKDDQIINLEGLRQQYLTRMIQETGQTFPSSEENTRMVLDIQKRFPFFLAVVLVLEPFYLPHYSFRTGEEPLIWFAVKNIMSDQMKVSQREGIVFQHAIHQNEMVYLMGVESLNENAAIKEWLSNILYGVNHYLKLDVTISMGSIVDHIDRMQQSYQLAKLALRNTIIRGTNQIYDYHLIQSYTHSRQLIIEDNDERLLFKLLSEGNEMALHLWIKQHVQDIIDFPTSTYSHLEWFCVDMHLLLRKFLLEKTQDTELVIGEMDDLQLWMQNLTSWNEAVNQINNQVSKIIRFLSKVQSYPVADVMEEIRRYIAANIHESISLQSIGEQFFINPTYFSKRFKDKYVQGYSDYLTDLRMDKAAAWMRETTLKVQEIAEMTGFDNAAYFSSVFKKSHGLSPKEYRQKHQQKA